MSYRTEFPDFDPADMPELPAGFEDRSWKNDACPSFFNLSIMRALWIDYRDPAMREQPETKRFGLYEIDGEGARINGGRELETDEWPRIVAECNRLRDPFSAADG